MISSPMQEDFAALADAKETYQKLQNQRIYITGASGQVGWYLIHFICFLIRSGRLQCELSAHLRSIHRLTEKFPDHAGLPCHFVVTDDAAQHLADNLCDLVIHCASMASPKHFAATPVDVMAPNALLTHTLLEQLRLHNPRCQFVYISTTGVTGFIPDEQRPSSEFDYGPLSCTDLSNCYLESKRFGEMLSLAYNHQYDIPVLIIRPSITYGPGFSLDDGRSYADFVSTLLKGRPIRLTSDGSSVRNFLYISDFIRGLLLVIDKASPGSIFNIASPSPISILELARMLNDAALDQPVGPVEYCGKSGQGLVRIKFRSTDASVEKLQSLGWAPNIGLLDGFRRTIRHYKECVK